MVSLEVYAHYQDSPIRAGWSCDRQKNRVGALTMSAKGNNPCSMIELTPVVQHLPDEHVADIPEVLRGELERVGLAFKPGWRVAIAVGSRGIAGLPDVVSALVNEVRARGGSPFIVPAMGSHGGATAEGQTAVLESYGITEEGVGAPVRSSTEVIEIPRGDAPCRVFMDKIASEADGIIVVNRVKAHTDFRGPHESGLVKMLVIGLGNQRQALEIHQHGVHGLRDMVPLVAREVLASGKVMLGVGLVENAHHNLCVIRAVEVSEFHAQDHELLQTARSLEARLPTEDIDVLIVDRMGKNISGTGLDTNVIGRICIAGESEPTSPRIKAIVVCGLTPESHGNAVGVGLADVITRGMYEQIEAEATAANVVTSSFLARGKTPIAARTPQQAFEWAVRSCGPIPTDALRVVRIRDTLSLEQIQVSLSIWEEIAGDAGIRRAGSPVPAFTPDGELQDSW
jgi:Domain of unknown function (DUF362)